MASNHSLEDQKSVTLKDTRWGTKALMRLFATIIGLIAMCLFAAAIGYENANYQNTTGHGDWPDGLALAPIVLSLLFNPVAFVMHLMFRKSRPIHPAFGMALDLLVWIISASAIVVCGGSGIFWLWSSATPDSDGSVDCMNIFNAWSQECAPIAYRIGRLQIAGIICLAILFIFHLVLFIFSCLDLRKRQLVQKLRALDQFDIASEKDPEQRSQGS